MSRRAHFIEVSVIVEVCRDPKVNFLLALVKDGKASHLITGDKDLLVLKKFGKNENHDPYSLFINHDSMRLVAS